ncbi:hypothetical protein BCE_4191 [Bacillus cereus ATCC 10987]|uniref:Uncharacterized protein n=1 Tax=Bacillus cereus (strain ATCC 10987 / NRS 248) TaxID=222523 RepID=Q731H5_BACC1|nr:hypothetical protein BCE_4191 [Bacillus cereus ATCC 10987]
MPALPPMTSKVVKRIIFFFTLSSPFKFIITHIFPGLKSFSFISLKNH